MSVVIAGGAGFIGCHLTRHFLENGQYVLVIDNLCRGQESFINNLPGKERLQFVKTNIQDVQRTVEVLGEFHAMHPVDVVWHMAANSDIPAGIADATVDLNDTFMTTHALLEAMKLHDIKKVAFASSSAVYGDHGPQTELCEATGPFMPISNYGAMKLASEAAISAAAESFLEQAWLFRFPNVVGIPATHGVLVDFIRKLKATPSELAVLGNGTQQKAYVHVSELVEAMLWIVSHTSSSRNCYNIGPKDAGVSVRQIAEDVVSSVAPSAEINYGSECRGWVGDVPRFKYSITKLEQLGFTPSLTSRQAVQRAIKEIALQEKVQCANL